MSKRVSEGDALLAHDGPITMGPPNRYWGKLRGIVFERGNGPYRIKAGDAAILVPPGAMNHQEHSGPHGKQLRWYIERAFPKPILMKREGR